MKALKVLLSIIIGLGVIFGGLVVVNQLNEQAMNEYIDSFARVEYENQLTPAEDELGTYFTTNKIELDAFSSTDSDFKVMQLTDVHIGGGFLSAKEDKKAINAVAAMITAEKPDLVIVTGDISFAVPWAGTINNAYAHRMFIRLMENLGVYWTVAFGNHDSEVYDYYDRPAVADFYSDESLEFCLFDRGPEGLYGECNHSITVRNHHGFIIQSLIMMDSNSYTDEDPLGIRWIYDNIHEDQIEWYRATVESQTAYNKALGEKLGSTEEVPTVKSLLFIHIPLMEVREAVYVYLEETDGVEYKGGKIGESEPYVYCSEDAENMFETILELGSTGAVFFGHDHLNNITFSYGFSIDYFAYSGINQVGSQRGCTVITCKPDTTVEITHENYYQDKYVPLYEKEVVDLTN